MLVNNTITNGEIQAIYDNYPDDIRQKLLSLRQLIYEVAEENPEIGALEETLKWGQISYLPKKRKVGTTVRLDQVKDASQFALYVPCSTSLLDTYRQMFADKFVYEGDRAIHFDVDEDLPIEDVKVCIYLALTYHLNK